MSYSMRSTLTISLSSELRRNIAKAAKLQGLTESEFVRRALRRQLWSEAFEATRRELVPKARAMGMYTDEDVFKLIS